MFQAVELPTSVTDLTTSLANVDRNTLPLQTKKVTTCERAASKRCGIMLLKSYIGPDIEPALELYNDKLTRVEVTLPLWFKDVTKAWQNL